MSGSSASRFRSPATSMILSFGLITRTSIVTLASAIDIRSSLRSNFRDEATGSQGLGRLALQRASFVWEDRHKVGQAGDVEDLYIVLAEPTSYESRVLLAGSGQEAYDEGDTVAVDIADITKVEQYDPRLLRFGLIVGRVQRVLCQGVNFSMQLDDDDTWLLMTYPCLKCSGWHWCPLSFHDQLDGMVIAVGGDVHLIHQVLDEVEPPATW